MNLTARIEGDSAVVTATENGVSRTWDLGDTCDVDGPISAEVERELDLFSQRHPGWRRYEGAMLEAGKLLKPGGQTMREYLEMLFAFAKGHA